MICSSRWSISRGMVLRSRRREFLCAPTGVSALYATTWSQEGNEARSPVRAHQGEPEAAGPLREPRRGDRGAHREQGEDPPRRVEDRLANLDEGHLVRTPRRTALRQRRRRPHPRPALQRREEAGHRGTLEDD